MNQSPSQKEVERIKKMYPKGTRIQIERMNDPYHPIEPGTKGTIDLVDDAGTLHCTFDNGRSLGVIPGEDSFHKIAMESEQTEVENMDETEETEDMEMSM